MAALSSTAPAAGQALNSSSGDGSLLPEGFATDAAVMAGRCLLIMDDMRDYPRIADEKAASLRQLLSELRDRAMAEATTPLRQLSAAKRALVIIAGKPHRNNELAAALGVTEPRASKIIRDLRDRGYVRQVRGGLDLRAKVAEVTKLGQATAANLVPQGAAA